MPADGSMVKSQKEKKLDNNIIKPYKTHEREYERLVLVQASRMRVLWTQANTVLDQHCLDDHTYIQHWDPKKIADDSRWHFCCILDLMGPFTLNIMLNMQDEERRWNECIYVCRKNEIYSSTRAYLRPCFEVSALPKKNKDCRLAKNLHAQCASVLSWASQRAHLDQIDA